MRNTNNIFGNIDWVLALLYLVFVFIGWLSVYAAVYNEEHQSIFDISQRYGKQLLWIGTSLLIAILILVIDQNFFPSFAYPIYTFILILLFGVLVFGQVVKGSKSWFEIGGFALQPSEFAKFATALALAKYLSTLGIRMENLRTKITAIFIILLPAVMVLAQNDTGSTLVFFAFIFVLYREGLSGNTMILGLYTATLFILSLLMRLSTFTLPFGFTLSGDWFLIGILGSIALLMYSITRKIKRIWLVILLAWIFSAGLIFSVDYIFEKVLEPHQATRINVLLGIESDPKGAGYNVNQSLIAIGSGGFLGKGFLEGTQTKFNFVPEQSTDFIFCTIGEEWGFVGSLFLIALFLTLFIRIIIVAERQRSTFTRIYGYSVASILFFHFMVNIGMAIGLAPVIGIPLPFISYGGSSLWSFTILLFILIKLDRDRLLVFR
ncbi:MAG: Peptidoglycan glycosyltransferase MrdB [Flavobacteriales bacterium]|nr:Peptidoglycan glycosyltransferase MrdB [Flavobacteriales bacterium]